MASASPLPLAPVILLLSASCGRPVVPDAEVAVEKYSSAIQRGDAAALYEMLTPAARRTYGIAGVERLLTDSRKELAARAAALTSDRATIETTAVVPYEDGEEAALTVQQGEFRVVAAAALPAGARTPSQALDELRQVLARRSYPGILRVLSRETRAAVERDVLSLVEGLKHPSTLAIEVQGDLAEVEVPGGHKVWLKQEAGVWKVLDFE